MAPSHRASFQTIRILSWASILRVSLLALCTNFPGRTRLLHRPLPSFYRLQSLSQRDGSAKLGASGKRPLKAFASQHNSHNSHKTDDQHRPPDARSKTPVSSNSVTESEDAPASHPGKGGVFRGIISLLQAGFIRDGEQKRRALLMEG